MTQEEILKGCDNDAYNTAFYYLCNKYGYRFLCYKAAFNKSLNGFGVKKRKEKEAQATDNDKILTFNDTSLDKSDKTIVLLMTQHRYSIQAKIDLKEYLKIVIGEYYTSQPITESI